MFQFIILCTIIISRLADTCNVDGRKSSGAPKGGDDAVRPQTTYPGVSWFVALSARLRVWGCASLDLALRVFRLITRRRQSSEVRRRLLQAERKCDGGTEGGR